MERRSTLGVLNSQTETANGNSLVKVIHLEFLFVELVNKIFEGLAFLLLHCE